MKFLITLLWCVFITTSNAQSLLQNGTFDANITPWESFENATWVSNDGANASGNGSIRFGDDFNNGASIWARSELLPATPGHQYIMAMSYKVPASSLAVSTRMSIYWYDDQGNYVGEYPWDQFLVPNSTDQWIDFDYPFENIIPDATQAQVYLWVNMPDGGTEESFALFDDVIFFQDTVFSSQFD